MPSTVTAPVHPSQLSREQPRTCDGSSRGFISSLRTSLGCERRILRLGVLADTFYQVTIAVTRIRPGIAGVCPEVGLPLVVATREPILVFPLPPTIANGSHRHGSGRHSHGEGLGQHLGLVTSLNASSPRCNAPQMSLPLVGVLRGRLCPLLGHSVHVATPRWGAL